jgi:ferrochelatase
VRIAVVLFNLGGPDSPSAIEPFLRNLFSDPAIISLPTILRRPLARLLAKRRARVAEGIYGKIGGRSPILPQTEAQASALAAGIGQRLAADVVRCFVAMRYWHPMADAVAQDVAAWQPDRIVLLPLYPQLSTTTSESSVQDWFRAAREAGLAVPTQTICCYPQLAGLVASAAALIRPQLAASMESGPTRLLFSAHGLPKKVIARGDPYAWQVVRTAQSIVAALDIAGLDWSVCYQSRVGPLEWIGPSTDTEIERAGRDRKAVVLFPVSFVSEHSETLVELDIEYAELAHRSGVPAYRRVPTLGTATAFIDGLADLVISVLAAPGQAVSNDGEVARCGDAFRRCPRREASIGDNPFRAGLTSAAGVR